MACKDAISDLTGNSSPLTIEIELFQLNKLLSNKIMDQ